MANSKGWFDPTLVGQFEWFDPQYQPLGLFDDELTDSAFATITQAGFKTRMVGGLRRMGAPTGTPPVGARAYWLPLLGVA